MPELVYRGPGQIRKVRTDLVPAKLFNDIQKSLEKFKKKIIGDDLK